MGYAIAEEAANLGAECSLNFWTCSLYATNGVEVIVRLKVHKKCMKQLWSSYDEADIVIKSAAVADYRPKTYHDHKMKKQPGEQVIELERTKDILLSLGKKNNINTDRLCCRNKHVDEYAKGKLKRKMRI